MSLTSSGATSASAHAAAGHSMSRSSGIWITVRGPGPALRSSASRSTPRNGPATTRVSAPLRVTTSWISGPVNRVLTGTSAAPADSAPSAATTQWCVLGEQIATRSPGRTPNAVNASCCPTDPFVQFAVGQVQRRVDQRGPVGEPGGRGSEDGRDGLHGGTSRKREDKQVLGRLA